MSSTKRRFSKEELARLGDAVYAQSVEPQLSPDDEGKFVAIDVETGDYDLDTDELVACQRLRERVPAAQIWLVRAGSRHTHRFGGRQLRAEP